MEQVLEIMTMECHAMEVMLKETEKSLEREHHDATWAMKKVHTAEETMFAKTKENDEQWEERCVALELDVNMLRIQLQENMTQSTQMVDLKRKVS